MSEPWATKKDLEAALRQIHLRLASLAAEGGGVANIPYDTAASHTHSGGGAYETAINISGKGQIQIFASLSADPSAKKTHTYKITVDGTIVITDLWSEQAAYHADVRYLGIWNFNTSFKLEHLSNANTAIIKAAYYLE